MRRRIRLTAMVVALLLLALVAYEAFAVWQAKLRTPGIVVEAAKGELQLSDLPKRRTEMLLKVEDPDFYRHHGVDLSTPGAGMTTITQSLVKRFYFEHFHKGFPKIEQSLIARFVLDPAMSKDRQLQAFINFANLGYDRGRPVTGFADAARTYYGRPLNQLTDDQFLSLVAMLIAPAALDPKRHVAQNHERVRRIKAMLSGECAPAGLRDVTYEACANVAR